jgi:hypothetical protein
VELKEVGQTSAANQGLQLTSVFTTEGGTALLESSVEQADEQPIRVGRCLENSSEGRLDS